MLQDDKFKGSFTRLYCKAALFCICFTYDIFVVYLGGELSQTELQATMSDLACITAALQMSRSAKWL